VVAPRLVPHGKTELPGTLVSASEKEMSPSGVLSSQLSKKRQEFSLSISVQRRRRFSAPRTSQGARHKLRDDPAQARPSSTVHDAVQKLARSACCACGPPVGESPSAPASSPPFAYAATRCKPLKPMLRLILAAPGWDEVLGSAASGASAWLSRWQSASLSASQ
jgi:hypothetical protein